jgi:hypothetical protein
MRALEAKFKENSALTVKKEQFRPFKSFSFAPLGLSQRIAIIKSIGVIRKVKT